MHYRIIVHCHYAFEMLLNESTSASNTYLSALLKFEIYLDYYAQKYAPTLKKYVGDIRHLTFCILIGYLRNIVRLKTSYSGIGLGLISTIFVYSTIGLTRYWSNQISDIYIFCHICQRLCPCINPYHCSYSCPCPFKCPLSITMCMCMF